MFLIFAVSLAPIAKKPVAAATAAPKVKHEPKIKEELKADVKSPKVDAAAQKLKQEELKEKLRLVTITLMMCSPLDMGTRSTTAPLRLINDDAYLMSTRTRLQAMGVSMWKHRTFAVQVVHHIVLLARLCCFVEVEH